MNKESIKLLKFLRKPESINYARIIYLDKNKRIPLVLDPEITKEIFTHKSIKAFDLWSYYQDLSKAHNLKNLNFYFTSTPLLLHGQTHRDSRLEILMLYKKLEPHLESWLESNIKPFFLSLSHDSLDSHIKITEFVLELLADLLQKSLYLTESPKQFIPDDFFNLLPSKQQLEKANEQLGELTKFIYENNKNIDENTIIQAITIVIMARQALIFGLHQYLNSKLSFNQSTPVNLIARTVTDPFEIENFSFETGQTIYLSPYLVEYFHPNSELSFGWGPHQCPGKSLALLIENELVNYPQIMYQPNQVGCKITRDLSSYVKTN